MQASVVLAMHRAIAQGFGEFKVQGKPTKTVRASTLAATGEMVLVPATGASCVKFMKSGDDDAQFIATVTAPDGLAFRFSLRGMASKEHVRAAFALKAAEPPAPSNMSVQHTDIAVPVQSAGGRTAIYTVAYPRAVSTADIAADSELVLRKLVKKTVQPKWARN